MNDRQLLEAAAKAAGIVLMDTPDLHAYGDGLMAVQEGIWSPLTDDGDAMRLAVKLEIDLCFGANYVIADGVQQPTVNNANDPCAAVRYAIVRAAAAMAKP